MTSLHTNYHYPARYNRLLFFFTADAKMATMVPLLYIPQNTADLHSCQSFSVENPNSLPDLPTIDCITFTVQIPKDAEIPQGVQSRIV